MKKKIIAGDTENDFPRVKLKYVKELGRGKYGKVRIGIPII